MNRHLPSLVLVAVSLTSASGCADRPSTLTVIADDRAVPGWAFIEYRADCEANTAEGSNRVFRVDDSGYGCSPEALPIRYYRVRVRIRDHKTGDEQAWRCWPFRSCSFSTVELDCRDGTPKRQYFEIYIGEGKSDKEGSAQRERLLAVGLVCESKQ